MTDKNAVEGVDEKAVVPTGGNSLIEYAIYQNAPIETLKELMALQERKEASDARKAYHVAMSDFHAETIEVVKDKDNAQYNSKYVSKGRLINTVSPFLSKHNLSHRFDFLQSDNGNVGVSCILTHRDGHSESVTMYAPVDVSGKKNPIQQIKSTKTYLEIATFESITGLASQDGSLDDDGNGAVEKDDALEKFDQWMIRLDEWAEATNSKTLPKFWDKNEKAIVKECGKVNAAKIYKAMNKTVAEMKAAEGASNG